MLYKKIFVMFCFVFGANLIMANDIERHQNVDGMSIYFGAIPAQLIKDHADMHGGATNKEYTYHIVIAIFDSKTKERIRNAKVNATVVALGMKGITKKLELMHGNLRSYGNYFIFSDASPYTINIEIVRSENGPKSIAKFIFNRPKD